MGSLEEAHPFAKAASRVQALWAGCVMSAQLLDFPLNSSMLDIPSALRELAEQIERGEHGEA